MVSGLLGLSELNYVTSLTGIHVKPEVLKRNLKDFVERVTDDYVKVLKAQADRVVDDILRKFVENVLVEMKKMEKIVEQKILEIDRKKTSFEVPRLKLAKEIKEDLVTAKLKLSQLEDLSK